ncbi:hypothetical protein AGOR_G00133280 [Albula goreensis]|uniref:Uncharacterized protein n=1 Tax=Albula goreensis TaxID=1534307 RepID=A0A8T3D6W2_9TELE|nr:hypothetical protein AGOR_G00133280 [Albula goreensis]
MSVCEINVHPSDSKRFDLKLPGEQVIYLKVQGSGGRQQWLVALGPAKACLTGIPSKKQKERAKGDHALRAKMSEMQVYCHLLVEQMQTLQGRAGLPECQAQSLVEASSFLRQTCCQFLMSLEDCMAMCTCRAATQQCRLLSPVSPSAVDCPNPHHKPPFMHPASLTEGLVLDGGLEAPYGQTVKRNLEEMSVLHAQRHSMASTSHQGASVTDDCQKKCHAEETLRIMGTEALPISPWDALICGQGEETEGHSERK